MRKFSPHLSIGIRWRKEKWMGGFRPHLSISIRWKEQMWMGGFPHIFSSVSYRGKEGGWGDSRTPLRSIRWPERWWTGGIPPTCLRKNPYMYFSIRWGKEVWLGDSYHNSQSESDGGNLSVSTMLWERTRYRSLASWDSDNAWFFFKSPQLGG